MDKLFCNKSPREARALMKTSHGEQAVCLFFDHFFHVTLRHLHLFCREGVKSLNENKHVLKAFLLNVFVLSSRL